MLDFESLMEREPFASFRALFVLGENSPRTVWQSGQLYSAASFISQWQGNDLRRMFLGAFSEKMSEVIRHSFLMFIYFIGTEVAVPGCESI